MTSRTNRHAGGQNQKGEMRTSPSALQRRRQEALERYLAGDPIAVICQEMGCAKSWLYKWKGRYQVTEPAWFQEHSRRPETSPTKTPAALAAEIVRLRQTLAPDGSGTVSAGVIRDHLRQHSVESLPSPRTIYRLLNRQAQEVNAHACPSYVSSCLAHLSRGQMATGLASVGARTDGKALETRGRGTKEVARPLWARCSITQRMRGRKICKRA